MFVINLLEVKGTDTLGIYSCSFTRETAFVTSCLLSCFPAYPIPFEKRSTPRGLNLLSTFQVVALMQFFACALVVSYVAFVLSLFLIFPSFGASETLCIVIVAFTMYPNGVDPLSEEF